MLATEDIRMLVDIGFMAVMRGLQKDAAAIFDGICAIRPDEDAAHIGKALLQLHRGDVVASIASLRARPPGDTVRVMLGMALLRHGNIGEALDILGNVIETARDAPIVGMARALMVEATPPPGPRPLR